MSSLVNISPGFAAGLGLQHPSNDPPGSRQKASHLFKASLAALKKTAQAVPTIGVVADVLTDAADLVQENDDYRKQHERFELNITLAAQGLEKHLRELGPERPPESVTIVAEELKRHVEYARDKQKLGRLQRHANLNQDIDYLDECYRRIESLFQQLQSDVTLSVWKTTNDMLRLANQNFGIASDHLMSVQLNGLNPAHQARYNSSVASQMRRHGCTSNTRELVLSELRDWASDPNASKIYWMNGMAGTGKTTIAYSLCAALKSSNQLAGSFFCSRTLPECQKADRIVPTIVYQLARVSHSFQIALCRELRDNPDLATYEITTQFEELLVKPISEIGNMLPAGLLVIVIDALDECVDRSEAQKLFDTILKFVAGLPIKFFITCRPEPYLLEKAISCGSTLSSIFHLHNIDELQVRSDIETYLATELEPLRIATSSVKRLAEMSGKLFIYAATAMRYIRLDHTSVNHQERLSNILDKIQLPSNKAYATLDMLYAIVVSSSLENQELERSEMELRRLVLHTTICARAPVSIDTLVGLLKLNSSVDVQFALQSLQSVLHTSTDQLVSPLHTSFPDYMFSQERAGKFFCNPIEHNRLLSQYCFDLMLQLPHYRIHPCKKQPEQTVSTCLSYACEYWSDHLIRAGKPNDLNAPLRKFLDTNMLPWMGVMKSRGRLRSCPHTMVGVQKWLQTFGASHHLQAFVGYIEKYVALLGFRMAANVSPCVYTPLSALWDLGGPVWSLNKNLGKIQEVSGRPPISLTLLNVREPRGRISSMALSYDGLRTASGCNDGTISVLDACSGDIIIGPFQGHARAVKAIAFSHDGNRIISGSNDCTIRLWDAYTGNCLPVSFEGHTGLIGSVIFSPDGNSIASGSSDCTIRVWDAHTGHSKFNPFRGHTAMVNSVAFSPDNYRVASGSDDCSARLWDVRDGCGLLDRPLYGHKRMVNCVLFSPDGDYLVSASGDHTIIIWDLRTGQVVASPLRGHYDVVTSVSFSPSGSYLISGSRDGTIRTWDLRASCAVRVLQDHDTSITFVAFSRDGDRIVSGCIDDRIRIWNVKYDSESTGSLVMHAASISCVAISCDCSQVVSGSSDGSVCLWSTHTGYALTNPLKLHSFSVSSVAFSLDRSWVASASSGGYTRVGQNDYLQLTSTDSQDNRPIPGPFGNGKQSAIRCMAFAPNGRYIASGSRDYIAYVWDIQPGHASTIPRAEFTRHQKQIVSISVSPTASHIISLSDDNIAHIWEAYTGAPVRTISLPDERIRFFSPSENCPISSFDSSNARIWCPHEEHEETAFGILLGPSGAACSKCRKSLLVRVPATLRGSVTVKDSFHSIVSTEDDSYPDSHTSIWEWGSR